MWQTTATSRGSCTGMRQTGDIRPPRWCGGPVCGYKHRGGPHPATFDTPVSLPVHICHTETEVPGVPSSTNKEPIRADVLVREMAPGSWTAAEIKVRHLFKGTGELAIAQAAQVDGMLRAVEAKAHAHYRPAQVRPWAMTSLGRPGEEMSNDLRRLARLRLRRPDLSRAVSVQ